MSINDDTLRQVARMRAQANRHVNATTRHLTVAWVRAWDDLAEQWDLAVQDLVDYQVNANGAWPPAWRIARAQRAMEALDASRRALDALARETGTRVGEVVPTMTAEAAEWQARIIASQLPTEAGTRAELTARFNRVDGNELSWIVSRTTQQVTALTLPLSDTATAEMARQLVRGIALGDNPRTTATRMVRNVEGAFNGGLTRAMTIARTEMLDAHREGARAGRTANRDVLTGWEWQATLDVRTCPSCLAMHGSVHDVDDPGPEDHQNGRCTAIPKARTWGDLGFPDLDEPADTLPDARAWFDGLPEADQVQVMGRSRLDLLRSGDVGWDDLTTRRDTPGWRPSQVVTPLRDLRA